MESMLVMKLNEMVFVYRKKSIQHGQYQKYFYKKKEKLLLKDLRRFNELTSENQRGLESTAKGNHFVIKKENPYFQKVLCVSFI